MLKYNSFFKANSEVIKSSPFTLTEILNEVKEHIDSKYRDTLYLIIAEIKEVRFDPKTGNYSFDLIDKQNDNITAVANAVIWRNNANVIEEFTKATGIKLKAGMKILFKAYIKYSPKSNLFLDIRYIDPSYTLGEVERRRREIIDQLRKENLMDKNKQLEFPLLPLRVAVISSSVSAGYNDFKTILQNSNYPFEITLFNVNVQGEQMEQDIVYRFEEINKSWNNFDVVVLVRGGGSGADLHYFDSYLIGKAIAYCPLPVLTGIGHTKDQSIADLVAYRAFNTPTAVANFIIEKVEELERRISEIEERVGILTVNILVAKNIELNEHINTLKYRTSKILSDNENKLNLLSQNLPYLVTISISREKNKIAQNENQLKLYTQSFIHNKLSLLNSRIENLKSLTNQVISRQSTSLNFLAYKLDTNLRRLMENYNNKLILIESKVNLLDPINILKRGYSITRLNGKVITSSSSVNSGDIIETILYTGIIKSEVKTKEE